MHRKDVENVSGDGLGGILLGFGAFILVLGMISTLAIFTSPANVIVYGRYFVDRNLAALALLWDCFGLVLTAWGASSSRPKRGT
jgi:hypothetical protein